MTKTSINDMNTVHKHGMFSIPLCLSDVIHRVTPFKKKTGRKISMDSCSFAKMSKTNRSDDFFKLPLLILLNLYDFAINGR